MIRRLINGNYFDNQLIVGVFYHERAQSISWLQLLQCDEMLLFSVSYRELNVCFWAVSRTKPAN